MKLLPETGLECFFIRPGDVSMCGFLDIEDISEIL